LIVAIGTATAQTTQDEYNYLVSLKAPYALLSGYSYGEPKKFSIDKESFEFKPVMRANGEHAATLLIVHADRKLGIKFDYVMCIPIDNKLLQGYFENFIDKKWDWDLCRSYSKATSTLL